MLLWKLSLIAVLALFYGSVDALQDTKRMRSNREALKPLNRFTGNRQRWTGTGNIRDTVQVVIGPTDGFMQKHIGDRPQDRFDPTKFSQGNGLLVSGISTTAPQDEWDKAISTALQTMEDQGKLNALAKKGATMKLQVNVDNAHTAKKTNSGRVVGPVGPQKVQVTLQINNNGKNALNLKYQFPPHPP